jgi:hypothetical protein
MLELGSSGSVRGVSSNGHPYRDPRSRGGQRAGYQALDLHHSEKTAGSSGFCRSGASSLLLHVFEATRERLGFKSERHNIYTTHGSGHELIPQDAVSHGACSVEFPTRRCLSPYPYKTAETRYLD